jgi:hypothetical protein
VYRSPFFLVTIYLFLFLEPQTLNPMPFIAFH